MIQGSDGRAKPVLSPSSFGKLSPLLHIVSIEIMNSFKVNKLYLSDEIFYEHL
jgi:hypothetical protein